MIEDNESIEKKEHNDSKNKNKVLVNILLGTLAVAFAIFSILVINV